VTGLSDMAGVKPEHGIIRGYEQKKRPTRRQANERGLPVTILHMCAVPSLYHQLGAARLRFTDDCHTAPAVPEP
jgi:hypothetical protein